MKKALFIAIVAVASLASCKKDRTCTCNTTDTSVKPTGYVAPPADVTTYTKSSKGQARANCLSSTRTYTSGSTAITETTTCTVK